MSREITLSDVIDVLVNGRSGARQVDAEAEALQTVQHYDAIGGGLGPKAFEIYQETCSSLVAPLMRKQALLEGAEFSEENPDAEVDEIDRQMERAWAECNERLRLLWLTDERSREDFK